MIQSHASEHCSPSQFYFLFFKYTKLHIECTFRCRGRHIRPSWSPFSDTLAPEAKPEMETHGRCFKGPNLHGRRRNGDTAKPGSTTGLSSPQHLYC